MAEASGTYPNLYEARARAHDMLSSSFDAGKRPVLLVASYERSLAERRLLAQSAHGFGVEVATLSQWVESLAQLHVQRAALVSSAQRESLAASLVASDGQEALPKTPGTVALLSQAVRHALCLIDAPAQLVGNEVALVQLMRAYAEKLHAAGCCEYCEMLQLLARAEAVQAYAPVVFDIPAHRFSTEELEFFDALGAVFIQPELNASPQVQRSPELASLLGTMYRRSAGDAPVAPTGKVKIALPAGPSAALPLVGECIGEALENNPRAQVRVVCPDPLAQFDFQAPLLEKLGVGAQVSASVAFADTDAGRAIGALCHIATADEVSKLEVAGLLHNPYLGVNYVSGFKAERSIRRNRLMDADGVLSTLAGNADDSMQGVVGLFERQDFRGALELLEDYTQAKFAGRGAYHTQQLRAIAAARQAFAAAEALPEAEREAALPLLVDVLQQQHIVVRSALLGTCQVEFCTMEQAAQADEGSVDAVVVCSLDAASYPVRNPESPYQTLLAKWGKAQEPDPLQDRRTAFFRTLASARDTVYLSRALTSEESESMQAATLFEEAMDCYRAKLDGYTDLNGSLGVAESLEPFVMQRGEEHLAANRGRQVSSEGETATLPPAGEIPADAGRYIVLSRRNKEVDPDTPALSASQIESYLECPYQWFAKRRLRLEGLDEGFSAVERGTFVHDALKNFYELFSQQVAPKVTGENLAEAASVMEQAFALTCEDHDTRRDLGQRYTPATDWEQRLRASLLPALVDSLANEAAFLPTFRPLHFEWAYGEEAPCRYAGATVVGRIDRIDVDDAGNAVVIDYKTSGLGHYKLRQDAGKGGNAGQAGKDAETAASPESGTSEEAGPQQDLFVLPHKVQTLLYAKVVREQLGLNVVAALYFNPIKGEVQGAFDSAVVAPQHLGYTGKQAEVNRVPGPDAATFAELVDKVERAIAQQVELLKGGYIQPSPAYDDVCQYCPVNTCAQRKKERRL